MKKPDSSRTNPYDLNATLKDRKPREAKSPSLSARSPYTLSHDSSLRAIVAGGKKR